MNKALARGSAFLMVAALASVVGCQRDGSASVAPSTAASGAASAGPAPIARAAPDTESSLAIKRGIVSLTAETRVLRLCGENEDLWLVQQDDLTIDDTYAKLAGEPGTPLFVEVRGERVASPPGTAIPATFKQAFVPEELLYAGVPAEGGGCATTLPAYRVLARGNEPSWSVEVGSGQLLLRQQGEPAATRFSVQETQDAEGSVTYRGTSSDRTLEITVSNNPCSDSMSGEYFAYTAELNLGGRGLRGCARVGE